MAPQQCTAFDGDRQVAAGTLSEVASNIKAGIDASGITNILIFDDTTGEIIEVDFRGTARDILKRIKAQEATPELESPEAGQEPAPKGPGRPKIGVISREVTLLPRHWEWLNSQPGGASVTLRKLVEEAKRTHQDQDRIRSARDATYRFMSAMAGNLPEYEEGLRALYAGNQEKLDAATSSWPEDIRSYVFKLSKKAFPAPGSTV